MEHDTGSNARPPPVIVYSAADGTQTVYRRLDETEIIAGPYANPAATTSHWSFFSTTSSNFTRSNLEGPGRVLGNLLEAAGRSLESGIETVACRGGLQPAWPLFEESTTFNPFNRFIPAIVLFFALIRQAASRDPSTQLAGFEYLTILAKNEMIFGDFKFSPSDYMTKPVKRCFRRSASWQRSGVDYCEKWVFYYNLTLRLWTDTNTHKKIFADSMTRQIAACLELCESADLYDRAIGMRFLEMQLALTKGNYKNGEITDIPPSLWLMRRILAIILPKLYLGYGCEDPKGVDQLTRRALPVLLDLHLDKRDDFKEYMTVEYCEDVLSVVELIARWRDVFSASHKRIFRHRYISPGAWLRSINKFLGFCISKERGVELSERARVLFASSNTLEPPMDSLHRIDI